jgi:hypothetical protein
MKRPSTGTVTPLAFPLRTSCRAGEGLICGPTYGPVRTPVNGPLSTPVDNAVDNVWNAPRRLWNVRRGAVHSTVQDTPGRPRAAALSRHNGAHRLWMESSRRCAWPMR